jgi:hypothetical protein
VQAVRLIHATKRGSGQLRPGPFFFSGGAHIRLFSDARSGKILPIGGELMPDFTVIDGGGPEGRDRIFAEQELRNALHDTAANMLRVIRGAGRPYELVKQFSNVVQIAIKFRDAFGHWPPSHMLGEMLAMHDEVHEMDEKQSAGRFTKADMDRWYEDGTMDRKYAEQSIKAGALQIVASQFVGQTLQERAGESEMSHGINKAIAAAQKSNKYWKAKYPAPAKKARKKRKPPQISL